MSKVEKIFYVYIPIVVSFVVAFLLSSKDPFFMVGDYFSMRMFLWLSISWILIFLFAGFFLRRLRHMKSLSFFSEYERIVFTLPFVLALVYIVALFIIPWRGYSELTDNLIPYSFYIYYGGFISLSFIVLMITNIISGIILSIRMIVKKSPRRKLVFVIISTLLSGGLIVIFHYCGTGVINAF